MRPQQQAPAGAYYVYDLSSPVFSTQELSTIFSPSTTHTSDGWGPLISSRISHITSRSPSQPPIGLCIGEFTSASVAAPSAEHGIPQIFPAWRTNPATQRFREMIASKPVIQPAGVGPAEILKNALDEFTAACPGNNPLSLTWALKFILVPLEEEKEVDWWKVEREEVEWKKMVRPVMLVCVTREGWARTGTQRRIEQFGKLFEVEVVVVSSIA